MNFIDGILKILRPFCLDEVKSKQKKSTIKTGDSRENKPERFVSLFIVGAKFYQYHNDASPKNFIKWLTVNHKEFYSQHEEDLSEFSDLSFENLIESIFKYADNKEYYQSLTDFLFSWFIQEHRAFRFIYFDCLFVSLEDSHLLQVLYRIPTEYILYLKNDTNLCEQLPNPLDYKNNWFIGFDSSNPLLKKFASYLIPGVNKQVAHFKLINDDKTNNTALLELLTKKGISNYVEPSFSSVTTIPNDDVTIARFNRYYKFNDFAKELIILSKNYFIKPQKPKDLMISIC